MRYAEPGTGDTSEVYAWLKDREEQAYWAPGRTVPWTPEHPCHRGCAERLAALRPVSLLPRWVWADRGKLHRWHRAIVSADGVVEFCDDDGSQWLAEQGL